MEDIKQQKSPMQQWAENEIKLACHHENPDWDGESFDYGCACYQSALRAFETLLKDGHSGNSWSETVHILERLCHHLPLMPITLEDFGYIKGVTPEMVDPKTGATLALCRIETPPSWESPDGCKNYNCSRASNLFLKVKPDGTYEVHDVNRAVGINVECVSDAFTSGMVSSVVDEMFPIKFPYYPSKDRYEVYTRTFLTDPSMGDFDTKEVLYIKTPAGEKIPVDRYWHEFRTKDGKDTEFREISREEYEELLKKRIDTQERKITGSIAGDVVDDIFEKGGNGWNAMLGAKWSPDYDSPEYEKNKEDQLSRYYCKIWWALERSVRGSHEIDPILNRLEEAIVHCDSLMNKLLTWSHHRAVARLDKSLLERNPDLEKVYACVQELHNWVNQKYEAAVGLINEYIKELEAIEDNDARYTRRDEILKSIDAM